MPLTIEEGKQVARWISRYPAEVPSSYWYRPEASRFVKDFDPEEWDTAPEYIARRYG